MLKKEKHENIPSIQGVKDMKVNVVYSLYCLKEVLKPMAGPNDSFSSAINKQINI